VKRELARGIDDWEQRLSTAMVKSGPTDLVRRSTSSPAPTTSATSATAADAEKSAGGASSKARG
jgi:hypothetical protein